MIMAVKTPGKIDLITGHPLKKVLLLSLPLIVSNLMHVLYSIVDTAWLGMLGKNEVAAMTFVFPIIFLIVSVGIGIGIAGSVLVAQYEGAGEGKKVNYAAAQTLSFTFFLTILLSVAGYLYSGRLVRLLGASEAVIPLARVYLRIIFAGLLVMFAFHIFNSLMRGWGNTVTPMKIMVASNLLNMALDPVLIFGLWIFPRMGIAGAAVATIVAKTGAAAAGLYVLFRGRHSLRIRVRDLKPDLSVIGKLLVIGWPAMVEHALKAAGIILLTAIVALFGTVYVAALGIGVRVFSVVIMFAFAVSLAVASAVGQNLGAGLDQRARYVARASSFAVAFCLLFAGAAIYFGSARIAGLFMGAGDREVIVAASSFLKRLGIAAPFMGVVIVMRGAFKGAGRTLQSMFIGITGLVVIRVIYAWVAAARFGSSHGVWNAFIVSGAAELLLCVAYYWKGVWAVPAVELPPSTGPLELPEEEEMID